MPAYRKEQTVSVSSGPGAGTTKTLGPIGLHSIPVWCEEDGRVSGDYRSGKSSWRGNDPHCYGTDRIFTKVRDVSSLWRTQWIWCGASAGRKQKKSGRYIWDISYPEYPYASALWWGCEINACRISDKDPGLRSGSGSGAAGGCRRLPACVRR